MVRTLVQSHLVQRGDTYYFRYTLPAHIREQCSSLPTEIKRSLRTDSYSVALDLVSEKLPLIKLIRNCRHAASIEKLFHDISDFTSNPIVEISQPLVNHKLIAVPTFSEAWLSFSNWKTWSDKQAKANQRVFNNLVFFIVDRPVDEVTKSDIRTALDSISKLPQLKRVLIQGCC